MTPFTSARPAVAFFSLKPCGQSEKPKLHCVFEPASKCDNDKIVCFVGKHFLKEEPLFKTLIPGQKPKEIMSLIRASVEQGLSVVARSCSTREIVGVSVNEKSCKLAGARLCKMSKEIQDCNLKKLFEVLAIVNLEPELFEMLGRDEVFHLAFLTVDDKHYGQGIGVGLMERSLDLGREKGFEFAKMNGMNENKSKIAEMLGMKKHWTKPFKEIMCRGIPSRDLPEPPHTHASVFYMNLKCPC